MDFVGLRVQDIRVVSGEGWGQMGSKGNMRSVPLPSLEVVLPL